MAGRFKSEFALVHAASKKGDHRPVGLEKNSEKACRISLVQHAIADGRCQRASASAGIKETVSRCDVSQPFGDESADRRRCKYLTNASARTVIGSILVLLSQGRCKVHKLRADEIGRR